MREPSGLKRDQDSSAGWLEMRIALPPAEGTLQRSPCQLKTTVPPSGLMEGMRGRETLVWTCCAAFWLARMLRLSTRDSPRQAGAKRNGSSNAVATRGRFMAVGSESSKRKNRAAGSAPDAGHSTGFPGGRKGRAGWTCPDHGRTISEPRPELAVE